MRVTIEAAVTTVNKKKVLQHPTTCNLLSQFEVQTHSLEPPFS